MQFIKRNNILNKELRKLHICQRQVHITSFCEYITVIYKKENSVNLREIVKQSTKSNVWFMDDLNILVVF